MRAASRVLELTSRSVFSWIELFHKVSLMWPHLVSSIKVGKQETRFYEKLITYLEQCVIYSTLKGYIGITRHHNS